MSELRIITRHAGTVLVGQLAVMAFGITDTIVAGRYAQGALAALSVGSAVYITVFVALMGTLQALLPTWAELHGAQRPHDLGRSVRQALYLAGAAIVLGMAALMLPDPLLRWTQVPEALQTDVRTYLQVLALALPPALLFRMFSTLNQGLGQPRLVTVLQLSSLLLKVPLTVWLVFGGAGLPALGVAGCAWATVVVNLGMLACALALLRTQALYRPYALWQRMEPLHWPTIAQFLRLGLPAGLSILVEVTSFTLMALFVSRQGTVAAAAHQIVSNLAAVLYMVPLSLAIATSARVSFWLGAEASGSARHALHTGFKLMAIAALLLSCLVLLGRHDIASVYSRDPEVVALAAALLAWLAAFHLGDAVQAMCVFTLRCFRVTVAPLVAYSVLLWGVGLTGGYWLAYRGLGPLAPLQSPAAFWMASSAALGLLALILPWILWRSVRRLEPSQRRAADSRAPGS